MPLSADFLGTRHRCFAVHFLPAGTVSGQVLYLPPFGEEMNRCRASVAAQARAFREAGNRVLLLDFWGTGESEGELASATLDIWYENISEAIARLRSEGDYPLTLWGCRLGGLMALDYLARHDVGITAALLWQPVSTGKTWVNQYLRLRTAALVDRGEEKETTAQMRARLDAGDLVEVAGYELNGPLVAAIDDLDMARTGTLHTERVYWLEHAATPGQAPAPRVEKALNQLRQRAARVELASFSGPPLWQLHERDECPELLATTSALPL